MQSVPPPAAAPRVLVVGCGGIGGTVCAGLLHQGVDVTPLTRNELIADAINLHGFRTRGEQALGDVPGRAVNSLGKKIEAFDYILLATQPPQVEEAARQVVPLLAEDGAIVCFQNGLCELRVSAVAGAERVIGGVVSWGASMVEPGVYDRTSAGGFTLGRLHGGCDDQVLRLANLLEAIGPVTLTDNLMGARWSKLAINCAISSLGTIGGDRLGPLMRKRFIRRLALEIMSETVAVARAEGTKLEKVSGTLDLDWLRLTSMERTTKLGSPGLVAKHALLLAVGTRYRRLRSSMLNAIERGREPAIDFLNGEVVQRAIKHGIATPVNHEVQQYVRRIASGELSPSHDTARQLFVRTRELLTLSEPPISVPVPSTSDITAELPPTDDHTADLPP
jgi:2-dehydropantoate 2-reductase